jgi:O-antigen/teichoic acid export membrane protein
LYLTIQQLLQSQLVRSVFIVATGAAGAQAITMAFTPLITRIYGPEAFGLMGAFMAVVSVVVPLAALAYPSAIVLPKDDRDALSLVRLSVVLSLGIAIVISLILLISGDWIAGMIRVESVAEYLLLVPLAALFNAWMEIARQWLIRKKEFGVVARTAVVQSLVLNSTKSGIGLLHPGGAVLIVIFTLGNVLYAALLAIGASRRWNGSTVQKSSEKTTSLNELAYRHRDFPIYRAPQNFINAASQSLPILMLSAFFGPAAAGYYSLGKMVMGVPSTLLGKAVHDVFYPRIAEEAHKGENLRQHIMKATGALLAVGILPFGLVIIFGPQIFDFFFGSKWLIAGEYARWLGLFFLFNFINKPCVAAVPVLGIQRGLLIYEIFSTGAKTLGLIAGFYWFGSDIWAIAMFSIIGVAAYILMMLWIISNTVRWKDDAKAS